MSTFIPVPLLFFFDDGLSREAASVYYTQVLVVNVTDPADVGRVWPVVAKAFGLATTQDFNLDLLADGKAKLAAIAACAAEGWQATFCDDHKILICDTDDIDD